jgi:hydroxyethylthiazole kinase-like uncharacterized protein yjeF
MEKVFQNCYALDKKCYDEYGLTEDILMEHAASGIANYIRKHFTQESSVLIVAGIGNNGADGIVLARQLHGDYDVKLYVPFEVRSPMAKLQLERVVKLGLKSVTEVSEAQVVVDALFGAGLNKPLNEETEHIIHKLNSLKGYKIACDVPTGVGESGQLMPLAFEGVK